VIKTAILVHFRRCIPLRLPTAPTNTGTVIAWLHFPRVVFSPERPRCLFVASTSGGNGHISARFYGDGQANKTGFNRPLPSEHFSFRRFGSLKVVRHDPDVQQARPKIRHLRPKGRFERKRVCAKISLAFIGSSDDINMQFASGLSDRPYLEHPSCKEARVKVRGYQLRVASDILQSDPLGR
jgi:hypothetical protein